MRKGIMLQSVSGSVMTRAARSLGVMMMGLATGAMRMGMTMGW